MSLVGVFDLAPTTMPVECIGAFVRCCLGQQLDFAVDPASGVMFCNVRTMQHLRVHAPRSLRCAPSCSGAMSIWSVCVLFRVRALILLLGIMERLPLTIGRVPPARAIALAGTGCATHPDFACGVCLGG